MQGDAHDFERLGPAGSAAANAASVTTRAPRHAEQIASEQEGIAELRPRGVGAVADLGLELAVARFAPAVLLATCLWMPVQYLTLALVPDPESFTGRREQAFEILGGSLLVSGLTNVMALLTAAIATRWMHDALYDRRTPWTAHLSFGLRRLLGLVGIAFLTGLLVVLGMFVFCIGALVAWWLFVLVPTVYVLEERSVGASLSRARQLATTKILTWESAVAFARWMGVFVVLQGLALGFSGFSAVATNFDVRAYVLDAVAISDATYTWVAVGVGALFLGVATVLQAGFLTAYWLDARVRRDGLDLQHWLARLRASAGATPAPSRP